MVTKGSPYLLALLVLAGCFGIPIHARTKKKPIPDDFNRIPYEWVEVRAGEKTTLRGIWVRNDGPPVLVLYGSGMGIAGIRDLIRICYEGGYSVLCCDYRGTGYSSGRWWTSGYLDDDAHVLWDWMRKEKGAPGGVVGVSIGAIAAAGLLTHPEPPAAIVLDRPVDPRTVIRRFLGQYLSPVGTSISRLVVRAKCDVDMQESLAAARTDALLMLPEYDVLCPPKDVEHMTARKAQTVSVRTIPGGHLSSHLVEPVTWRTVILDFLDARLRPGRPPKGGRQVTPDPARVVETRLEKRTLHVVFDRDELPATVTLLIMGRKANSLLRVKDPRRELSVALPRKHVRRLGRLMAVRAVPKDFRKTVGTRWIDN